MIFLLGYNMKIVIQWGNKPLLDGILPGEGGIFPGEGGMSKLLASVGGVGAHSPQQGKPWPVPESIASNIVAIRSM